MIELSDECNLVVQWLGVGLTRTVIRIPYRRRRKLYDLEPRRGVFYTVGLLEKWGGDVARTGRPPLGCGAGARCSPRPVGRTEVGVWVASVGHGWHTPPLPKRALNRISPFLSSSFTPRVPSYQWINAFKEGSFVSKDCTVLLFVLTKVYCNRSTLNECFNAPFSVSA